MFIYKVSYITVIVYYSIIIIFVLLIRFDFVSIPSICSFIQQIIIKHYSLGIKVTIVFTIKII